MKTPFALSWVAFLLSVFSAQAAPPEWVENASRAEVPDAPVEGSVAGEPFKVEKATLRDGILKLRQGKDFFADAEFIIFLFLDEGEELEGKKFKVAPEDGFGSPHVHMGNRKEGEDLPDVEMFMNKYSMRLEFGEEADGILPGKIYLCLPDEAKSRVAGTFEAEIEDAAGEP